MKNSDYFLSIDEKTKIAEALADAGNHSLAQRVRASIPHDVTEFNDFYDYARHFVELTDWKKVTVSGKPCKITLIKAVRDYSENKFALLDVLLKTDYGAGQQIGATKMTLFGAKKFVEYYFPELEIEEKIQKID